MALPLPTHAPPRNPLDSRLVFVTGKGGAGKSTVAAALGLLGAREERRTIIAELSQRGDVRRALAGDGEHGSDGPAAEAQMAANLFAIAIDPERALEEYLVDQLPVRLLASRLAASRTFNYLAAATPGLRELLAIGKAWELAQPQRRSPGGEPYDLVVVDAPATGHGVAFLGAPRTFAAAAAVGPVARQASIIHATLCNPAATCVVAVATPTEASIAEALALRDSLARVGIEVARLVVNGVVRNRFAAGEMALVRAARAELPDAAPPVLGSALRAAGASHRAAQAHRAAVARARRAWGDGVLTLPALSVDCIGEPELQVLAHALATRL